MMRLNVTFWTKQWHLFLAEWNKRFLVQFLLLEIPGVLPESWKVGGYMYIDNIITQHQRHRQLALPLFVLTSLLYLIISIINQRRAIKCSCWCNRSYWFEGPDFTPMDIRERKWVENNKNRLGNDKTNTI